MFFGAAKRDEWDEAIDAFERRPERAARSDRLLRRGNPEVAFERREFLEQHPWPIFRGELNRRLDRRDTRSRLNLTLWFSGLGMATSLAVALLLLFGSPDRVLLAPATPAEPGLDGVRSKGAGLPAVVAPDAVARFQVLVGDEALGAHAAVAPDAELNFRVDTGGYDYVLVFGVEADGALTPYYPAGDTGVEEQSLRLGRVSGWALPDSVQLDGRPVTERFICVFSPKPLTWGQVRDAAERAFRAGGEQLERMGPLGLVDTQESAVWLEKRR